MLLGILHEWLAYLECSAWRLQVAFKLDTSSRVRNNECHCCWLLIKLRTVSSQFFWRAGNRGTERKSANVFVALSISNFKCQLENQALCPYLYPLHPSPVNCTVNRASPLVTETMDSFTNLLTAPQSHQPVCFWWAPLWFLPPAMLLFLWTELTNRAPKWLHCWRGNWGIDAVLSDPLLP